MIPVLYENEYSFSYELLLEMSNARNPLCYYLLSDEARNNLNQIKTHFAYYPIEANEIFHKWMTKHKTFPPLEFICWLHTQKIVNVTVYFYRRKQYCDYFYKIYDEIYSNSNENVHLQGIEIVSTITAAFTNTINHPNEDLKFFVEEVLGNIIVKITGLIENNSLKRTPLCDIKNFTAYNDECIQHFAYLNLKYLLSFSLGISRSTVIEVHTKQWTSSHLLPVVKDHIKEVLILIPTQDIVNEINERISGLNFCWKYLLIIVSFLIESLDGAALLKRAVDSWLKQSFEEDNISNLYAAVVTARHCCYEKARYFQSYANWFSSITFKNSKHFALFFKFLTEILPHEPPLYLKIHLNKVPSAPHGCQSVLVDYITLAKTRLADLNESGEYIGLFSDHHETDEEGQQADVARVVAHYLEFKEIAKPLLEAYILRRQYYEKIFLKQLLKIPERNDTERAQVIHHLQSIGKIPSSLYNAWRSL